LALVTVDISAFQVADSEDDVLITYALGSCIAVIVHDPVRKIGGMIHYMLPQSSLFPEKARIKPAMFADTGVPLLFHAMYERSCSKSHLVVKVVGGSQICDDTGTFDIGRRNYAILRRMLEKAGITITAEDVAGAKPRTVKLYVGTGRVTLRSANEETDL
jgi:chemotaxis protein CheD